LVFRAGAALERFGGYTYSRESKGYGQTNLSAFGEFSLSGYRDKVLSKEFKERNVTL
jgi:hypothetical protein